MARWASFVVVAVLATLIGAPSYAGAHAAGGGAGCADGVSVVVERGGLGGGTTQDCRPAGDDAASLLEDSGLDLDFVQQQPTFICRVNGEPADDPCVTTPPQDAYWGLWWSDGESPTWRYSTVAASGLSVPAGGAVALAWQDTPDRVPPGVQPPVAGEQSETPAGSADTTSTPAGEDTAGDSGLPAWVGPLAVLALAAAGAVVLLGRRARS